MILPSDHARTVTSALADDWLPRLRAALRQDACSDLPISEPGVDPEGLTPAAVLVGIVCHPQPTILLTKRTDHLRDHPGQISFPGGRVETADRTPVDTALREAEEEVGIAPAGVEIIGCLPPYCTVTGFSIQPVVALLQPPVHTTVDPFEVAEVFEVPLAFLLDERNHQEHEVDYQGRRRRYVAIPYAQRYIWGATAGILRVLARRLR